MLSLVSDNMAQKITILSTTSKRVSPTKYRLFNEKIHVFRLAIHVFGCRALQKHTSIPEVHDCSSTLLKC